MIRSVFTKYVTAFMLIILLSFSLLSVIVSSMVTGYSMEQKEAIVSSSAENVKDYLEKEYAHQDGHQLEGFLQENQEGIFRLLAMMADYTSDLSILIFDPEGGVIMAAQGADTTTDDLFTLSAPLRSTLDEGGFLSPKGKQDSLPQRTICCLTAVFDENKTAVGYVYCGVSSDSLTAFVQRMIKTIILSSLWVMLAALIAVYFISDRIIGPLRHMSHAAKSFATGHFDIRVPVKGDDEVAELAVAFNSMAASLSDNDEMRRTFLANVSHDLRTPMTTIAGFIDGILDGTIPKEKQEYYLQVISKEVRRLSRLVATLLDISRIQAGDRKFVPVPFNICEMARQILISFEQKIEKKHLEVAFDCEEERMCVLADRDAVYQILYNLCDNAVKFSREGGVYRIRITRQDKKALISVYNEGQGIPEADLPHVFDRFYKSDRSRGLDKSGVGLGLYIAKTILDAHREEIWVKSLPGENCEFLFTLPYTLQEPKREGEAD